VTRDEPQTEAGRSLGPGAIVVENLSKEYGLGIRGPRTPRPSRRSRRVREHTLKPSVVYEGLEADDEDEDEDEELEQRPRTVARHLRALQDVSFRLEPGAALGLIGPNGAGKSTLLKVLARVTPPSSGRAIIGGRVAPLLDLAATLMQPESSGRDNVHVLARLFVVPRHIADRQMERIM
jgi:lipopolysaccharide transport system ATP-binding protein